MRPRIVSRIARGCSKISLSMRCLYPLFSAMSGSHSTCCTERDTGLASGPSTSTPRAVRIATSRSSRWIMSRVRFTIAGMSEAMKFSCLPRPISVGRPSWAATILPGSSLAMAATAHLPSISAVAPPSASSSGTWVPWKLPISLATTSASEHSAGTASRIRSSSILLGLPDSATTISRPSASRRPPGPAWRERPSAQLVWPIPNVPWTGSSLTVASRLRSFPSACHT